MLTEYYSGTVLFSGTGLLRFSLFPFYLIDSTLDSFALKYQSFLDNFAWVSFVVESAYILVLFTLHSEGFDKQSQEMHFGVGNVTVTSAVTLIVFIQLINTMVFLGTQAVHVQLTKRSQSAMQFANANETAVLEFAKKLQLSLDIFTDALDTTSFLVRKCKAGKKVAINRTIARMEISLHDGKRVKDAIMASCTTKRNNKRPQDDRLFWSIMSRYT